MVAGACKLRAADARVLAVAKKVTLFKEATRFDVTGQSRAGRFRSVRVSVSGGLGFCGAQFDHFRFEHVKFVRTTVDEFLPLNKS